MNKLLFNNGVIHYYGNRLICPDLFKVKICLQILSTRLAS